MARLSSLNFVHICHHYSCQSVGGSIIERWVMDAHDVNQCISSKDFVACTAHVTCCKLHLSTPQLLYERNAQARLLGSLIHWLSEELKIRLLLDNSFGHIHITRKEYHRPTRS